MSNEAEGVSEDDIVAETYYEKILNDTLPQIQAEQIALEQFNVVLEGNLLNQIMGQYVCSSLSVEDCVRFQLKRHKVI